MNPTLEQQHILELVSSKQDNLVGARLLKGKTLVTSLLAKNKTTLAVQPFNTLTGNKL